MLCQGCEGIVLVLTNIKPLEIRASRSSKIVYIFLIVSESYYGRVTHDFFYIYNVYERLYR